MDPCCFHLQGKIISCARAVITGAGVDGCERDTEGYFERGWSFVSEKVWRTGENCCVEEEM